MVTKPRVMHPVMDRVPAREEKRRPTTRLMRPETEVATGRFIGGLRCRCFECPDGERHCYATGQNVAGRYLVWREVRTHTDDQARVDSWSGQRTRHQARRLAMRRAERQARGRGSVVEIPDVLEMPNGG